MKHRILLRSNNIRSVSTNVKTYLLGDYKLQGGMTIPNAKIAFATYGQLNTDKSNVIVYPTWYSGFVGDNEWLIGKGMGLDPLKYFVIVPCAFGNGQSSSPSNTPEPYNKARFPAVTLYDNVVAQHRLVTEVFGIKKVKMVTGWSMGAQQTFQWASLYPDMVDNIAPFCGSAKTSPHNFVFLEGVKAALTADGNWNNGWYCDATIPKKGLRSVGRVYAGWGLSQPFYMQETWRKLGFHSLEDFLVGNWEKFFLQRDPNNLLAMLNTWQTADISANPIYKGDFKRALGAIKAKSIVLSPQIDLYFPLEDNTWEVQQMTNAKSIKQVIIPGVWGHFSGAGAWKEDTDFIDKYIKELLADYTV